MSAPQNNQEIFDRVVAHLRKQNAKAMTDGWCRYRGDNGLKCAVGCLISDENYNPAFETENIETVCSYHGFEWMNNFRPLLHQLQKIHDMEHISSWESEFIRLARMHKLKYAAP